MRSKSQYAQGWLRAVDTLKKRNFRGKRNWGVEDWALCGLNRGFVSG